MESFVRWNRPALLWWFIWQGGNPISNSWLPYQTQNEAGGKIGVRPVRIVGEGSRGHSEERRRLFAPHSDNRISLSKDKRNAPRVAANHFLVFFHSGTSNEKLWHPLVSTHFWTIVSLSARINVYLKFPIGKKRMELQISSVAAPVVDTNMLMYANRNEMAKVASTNRWEGI